jgi:uncharacterized Fe-S radical SAM superfamily protein PflX
MDQYHPCCQAYPPLDRRIAENEFAEAVKLALDADFSQLD